MSGGGGLLSYGSRARLPTKERKSRVLLETFLILFFTLVSQLVPVRVIIRIPISVADREGRTVSSVTMRGRWPSHATAFPGEKTNVFGTSDGQQQKQLERANAATEVLCSQFSNNVRANAEGEFFDQHVLVPVSIVSPEMGWWGASDWWLRLAALPHLFPPLSCHFHI